MAQLHTVTRYLDSLLPPDLFEDRSLNGLQVDAGGSDVKRVALAVDAGESVILRAIDATADLLIVHHGLFWGAPAPLSGPLGAKIRSLVQKRCSLYASHLPLDAHLEVGNNAELGRAIGLAKIEAAFEHRGQKIGITGQCTPHPLGFFTEKMSKVPGAITPLALPFGKDRCASVGVITGAGAFALEEAAKLGLDLFITGEPRQEAFHLAKEFKINVIFAGHYATETFGVLALGRRIEKDLDIKTVFIDEPTGI